MAIESVKVAPDFFGRAILMGTTPKREFNDQTRHLPDEQRPHQRNADGVPLWRCELAVTVNNGGGRNKSEVITVTVAAAVDPLDTIGELAPVALVNPHFSYYQNEKTHKVSPFFRVDGLASVESGVMATAPAGKGRE